MPVNQISGVRSLPNSAKNPAILVAGEFNQPHNSLHLPIPRRTPSNMKKEISQEVNRLFQVYREHTNREPMIGGAQNLIKQHTRNDSNSSEEKLFQFSKRPGHVLHFEDLALQVKLYIFQLLSPTDLCRISTVCRDWLLLSSDEYLWKKILLKHSKRWERIYDDKNPDFFKRVCPGLPSKQIYLRCHPESPSSAFRMPNLLQYLVSAKPRVVMFGPGLETKTSKLVRSILSDKHVNETSRFKVTGMVPGEFAGIGSGISLKFCEHQFNLVTLYSNTKSVRQRLSAENRVQQNKLFHLDPRHHSSNDASTSNVYEVTPSIQELCKRSDAFVFVVDATQSADEIALAQAELFAMMCELWSSTQAPLLVLSCSRGTWSPSYHDAEPQPAIDVVRALRLGRLKRRWLVQTGEVETLHGIRSGMKWLLSNSNQNLLEL